LAILLSLQKWRPMTQAALSAVTRMDRSTINEMVPRMIERELIKQTNSPDDKRSLHLSITIQRVEGIKGVLPGNGSVAGPCSGGATERISAHLQTLSGNDHRGG